MPESHVVVLGSINTDLVIRGDRLPAPGETVVGGEFFEAAGGKGANQAVAAARAGTSPVTLIAAVGDDPFGRRCVARLAAENLDCRFIRVVPNVPSGVALILVDRRGENLISVASGANACLSPDDVAAINDETFRRAKVFLACLESPAETVAAGVRRAKRAGLATILNPAPAVGIETWMRDGLLGEIDVVVPNRGEAAAMTGIDVGGEAGVVAAAQRLLSLGCGAAVITLGSAGCAVAERDGNVALLPGHSVRAVDTTAAGDALCGALAVALSEGKPLVDAARWAMRGAAISVTRAGAQPSLPTRAEIDAFDASVRS